MIPEGMLHVFPLVRCFSSVVPNLSSDWSLTCFKPSSPSCLRLKDPAPGWEISKRSASTVTRDAVGANVRQRRAISNLVGGRGRRLRSSCGHGKAKDGDGGRLVASVGMSLSASGVAVGLWLGVGR